MRRRQIIARFPIASKVPVRWKPRTDQRNLPPSSAEPATRRAIARDLRVEIPRSRCPCSWSIADESYFYSSGLYREWAAARSQTSGNVEIGTACARPNSSPLFVSCVPQSGVRQNLANETPIKSSARVNWRAKLQARLLRMHWLHTDRSSPPANRFRSSPS
jgi:hypothetical protein